MMKTLQISFLLLVSAAVMQCLPRPDPQMSMGMGMGSGMYMSPIYGYRGMQPMQPIWPLRPLQWNTSQGSGGGSYAAASGSSTVCGPDGCRLVHYFSGPPDADDDEADTEDDLDGEEHTDKYQAMFERLMAKRAAAKKAKPGKQDQVLNV